MGRPLISIQSPSRQNAGLLLSPYSKQGSHAKGDIQDSEASYRGKAVGFRPELTLSKAGFFQSWLPLASPGGFQNCWSLIPSPEDLMCLVWGVARGKEIFRSSQSDSNVQPGLRIPAIGLMILPIKTKRMNKINFLTAL